MPPKLDHFLRSDKGGNQKLVPPSLFSFTVKSLLPDLSPSASELEESIREAVANTDTNPTEAQKKSGDYKKGKFKWNGLTIALENPRGSVRFGKNKKGEPWAIRMAHHYGYLLRTEGTDGDHIDCFIGPYPTSDLVFVVYQLNEEGKFDEHKCMLGFKTLEDAKRGYLACYEPNWHGFGGIHQLSVERFKEWLKGDQTDEPMGLASFKSLQTLHPEEDTYRSIEGFDNSGLPDKIPAGSKPDYKSCPQCGHEAIKCKDGSGIKCSKSPCDWSISTKAAPNDIISRLQETCRSFSHIEGLGPDYQRLLFHPVKKIVWWVSADGDEGEDIQEVIRRLEKVTGVRKVKVEAESSPKDDGWLVIWEHSKPVEYEKKAMSYLSNGTGGALVPPAKQGKDVKRPNTSLRGPSREIFESLLVRTKDLKPPTVGSFFGRCKRDEGGQCLPEGQSGESAPGETSSANYPHSFTETFDRAKDTVGKFKVQLDSIRDPKLVNDVKESLNFVRKLTKKFTDKVMTRYGKVGGLAVLTSGQAVGWGVFAVSTASGVPLYIPGSTILGSLPGVAVAEAILQLRKHLTHHEKSLELSEEEAKRIWHFIQQEIKEEYEKYLAEKLAIEPDGETKTKAMPVAGQAPAQPAPGSVAGMGFTGKREDSLGRNRCYQDGILVPCQGGEAGAEQQGQGQQQEQPPAAQQPAAAQQGAAAGEQAQEVNVEDLPPLDQTPGIAEPDKQTDMNTWLDEVKTHPYIQAAETLLIKNRQQTIDQFFKDGKWDEERVEEVHEPIINHFLNPKAKPAEGEKPKLYLLIGPFGAGKTTAGGPTIKEHMPNHTLVNPDEIKSLMPEDTGWNATNIHEETSHLAKEIQKRARAERHHILFDGSGQNVKKMNNMANDFTADGYEVHVVHVTVPKQVSVYRAAKRFLSNPFQTQTKDRPASRYAPLDYVFHEVDSKPDKTYEVLKNNPNVKSGVSYSNDKPIDDPIIEIDKFER